MIRWIFSISIQFSESEVMWKTFQTSVGNGGHISRLARHVCISGFQLNLAAPKSWKSLRANPE
jgi:hypothetical protein